MCRNRVFEEINLVVALRIVLHGTVCLLYLANPPRSGALYRKGTFQIKSGKYFIILQVLMAFYLKVVPQFDLVSETMNILFSFLLMVTIC